jgi:multiple sugar transport system permease protein
MAAPVVATPRPTTRGFRTRLARRGWWFAIPGLTVVALVTVFPIAYSLWMSVNRVTLGYTGMSLHFEGLANYRLLVQSPDFLYSLLFTIGFTVVTVSVELVLGLGMALVMYTLTGAKSTLLTLMLLPWSIITVVSAELWRYIDNGTYGVLNAVFMGLHLANQPIVWLGTTPLAILSVVVADVWKTTPFVGIILLAGLQMVDQAVLEAARIDGAGGWSLFWFVMLPLIEPAMAVAVLFRLLQAFGVFDLPFVLTGGGPGIATSSLGLFAWQVMFQDLDFGPGAAIAVVTTLLVLGVSLLSLRLFRRQVEETAP